MLRICPPPSYTRRLLFSSSIVLFIPRLVYLVPCCPAGRLGPRRRVAQWRFDLSSSVITFRVLYCIVDIYVPYLLRIDSLSMLLLSDTLWGNLLSRHHGGKYYT